MKYVVFLIAFCIKIFSISLEESLAKSDENIAKIKEDKVSKQVFFSKPQEYKSESVDFNTFTSNTFASMLNLSSYDKTEANIDFNTLNLNIKSLNRLLEYKNSTLLFEKQARISQDEQAYSVGIINRYEIDKINFGINAFSDQYNLSSKRSFGAEVQFSDFIKAYANYYDYKENDSDDSKEFGFLIDLPYLNIFNINTNVKQTQNQYNISYSPFSILDLSLNYQDDKINKDQSSAWIKFKLNYEESLMKQFYNSWYNQKNIDKFDKYDFVNRTY